MTWRSLDQMAAEMAVWFLSKLTVKLGTSDVTKLERFIEFFKHMENYIVKIGDDEQFHVSCVARSWLPSATDGDKIVCGFSFDGIYAVFDVFVIVPGDHGLILRVETDFQGDFTGQTTDFVLFSAVADKVLEDSLCKIDAAIPSVELST